MMATTTRYRLANLLTIVIAGMMLLMGRNTALLHKQSQINARVEQTLEELGTAFVEIDRHGGVTEWSHSAERMFGFTRDEMTGRTLQPIMRGELFSQHQSAVPKAFEDGKRGPFDVKCDAISKDGSKIPVSVRVRIEGDRAKALIRRIDVKQLDWRRK